jgi:hypothetical protein
MYFPGVPSEGDETAAQGPIVTMFFQFIMEPKALAVITSVTKVGFTPEQIFCHP